MTPTLKMRVCLRSRSPLYKTVASCLLALLMLSYLPGMPFPPSTAQLTFTHLMRFSSSRKPPSTPILGDATLVPVQSTSCLLLYLALTASHHT